MAALLLASASPRRRELLDSVGVVHDVRPSHIDESLVRGSSPKETAGLLARAKTEAVLSCSDSSSWQWILGLDTLIDLDGAIIEKATDRADALQILQKLSGRTHRVVTAVCLYSRDTDAFKEGCSESSIRFKDLSDDEIHWFLDSGEWQGAAGAYMIQGRAACFIEELCGSHSGVVGLPLPLVYGMLKKSGYRFGQFA